MNQSDSVLRQAGESLYPSMECGGQRSATSLSNLTRPLSYPRRRRASLAAALHTTLGWSIGLFILGAALAGCMRREPPADLVVINGQEPESLDPALVTGIAEMRITKALFEGLLRLDPRTARPIPALAERWEISPDGKRYTFYLRTNAAWSTGQPITTADVAYSWMRALSPTTAGDYAGQLFYLKNAEAFYTGKVPASDVGIRAPSPYVLEVELEQPVAFFLDLCALPTLTVVPRQFIEKYGDRWLNQRGLPCSGAFQLVAWRLNDKVRVRKNQHYWDVANTQSELVDILPASSANVALNLYETGVADVVWDKDLVPSELLDKLLQRADFHSFTYLGTYFYRFNVTRKPFDDPRVRKAFALVTNKERIVTKLTKGGEKAADHYVPDGVANYESPAGLAYDPEQGRKLLAEAGFPNGTGFPHLQYSFFASPKMQGKIAVELQQMWREGLGVEIELRQIERKVFYSQQSRLDYDLSASSWIGDYNDANTFLDMFMSNSGNNRTGWKSEAYDRLIREANVQTDIPRRAELFRQAEKLLVTGDTPIVPIYFYAGINYFDTNKIQGVYQNILDEHPLQTVRQVERRSNAQRRSAAPSAPVALN
jgi:oligopeptide transport system substrate-binding protein